MPHWLDQPTSIAIPYSKAQATPEYINIPPATLQDIYMYVEKGRISSDFLTAVISNDLKGTFNKADIYNETVIKNILRFLWNQVPADCWGSVEKMQTWIKLRNAARGNFKV